MTSLDRPDADSPEADGPHSTDVLDDQAGNLGDAVEVVRSEERLDVGTVVRVSGRAVLRRYVVTETVTKTFQVRREEFRVDQEPLPAGDRTAGAQVAGDERPFANRVVETVLHREEPVVTMRVVATERVRVHVDTVTEQVQVSEDVAREQVDVDVPDQADIQGDA